MSQPEPLMRMIEPGSVAPWMTMASRAAVAGALGRPVGEYPVSGDDLAMKVADRLAPRQAVRIEGDDVSPGAGRRARDAEAAAWAEWDRRGEQ